MGLQGLLAHDIPISDRVSRHGAVALGTPNTSTIIAELSLELSTIGGEGYRIRSLPVNGYRTNCPTISTPGTRSTRGRTPRLGSTVPR